MQGDAARPGAATAPLRVYHKAVQTSLTPALGALMLQTRLVSCLPTSTIRFAGSHNNYILNCRLLLRAHGHHPLLRCLPGNRPSDRLPRLQSA